MVKNLPEMQETWVQSLGWEDPLEESMAAQSSILAWRIPMDRGAWGATVQGCTELHTTKHSTGRREDKALVTQLCLTLCDPMDCSLPAFSICGDSPGKNTGVGFHAFLQGIFPTQGSNPDLPHCRRILKHLSHQGSPRILEWVAYSFCRGSSQTRN